MTSATRLDDKTRLATHRWIGLNQLILEMPGGLVPTKSAVNPTVLDFLKK